MTTDDSHYGNETKSVDFDAIFSDASRPEATRNAAENVPAAEIAQKREGQTAPSWAEIKRKQWGDIEARYNAGSRDKETVCAWMAYKAALVACKAGSGGGQGWGRNSFDELLTEGYQYAIKRWPDYDPTKATKNGISGFLYKQALGRMRNAAHERFTTHGKRKHRRTDVIPTVVVSEHVEHIANERQHNERSAVTARHAVDVYADKADVGSIHDKAVTAAAKRSKSVKLNWTTEVKTPTGGDRNASRLARIATEIRVHRLLSLLPRGSRELISRAWGIEGVKKATIEELAEYAGCSVATMYNRINRLLIELKFISTRPEGKL